MRGTSGPDARARSTWTPPRPSVLGRHGCRSESVPRAFARSTMTPLSSAPGQTRGFDRRREPAPQTTARALSPANRPYPVPIIWARQAAFNANHVRNRPSRFTGTERADVPRKAPCRIGATPCTKKIASPHGHWDCGRSDHLGRTSVRRVFATCVQPRGTSNRTTIRCPKRAEEGSELLTRDRRGLESRPGRAKGHSPRRWWCNLFLAAPLPDR